jgi:putative ABC transport system substrate-binding protein
MLDRRAFIGTLALLVAPRATEAQPEGKVIGYLTPAEIPRALLVEALRDLGYVESRTIRFDVRSAENDLARLPELAGTLVRAKVDIIVAVSPPAIRAASRPTRTTPIVMAFWGGEGLLESGIVASFARPGANVTGLYMFAAELDAKRLELLATALPNAKRIAVLNPGLTWGDFNQVRRVAEAAKIQLRMIDVPGSTSYERAFGTMVEEQVEALLVPSFPRFYREHREIVAMAGRRRIPAMYEWGEIARAGGLMAYGPVMEELTRRTAHYVDKILRGSNPADLPVEQPTKYELIINLKTAKALGLTIPPSVLARADQVIE